MADQKSRPLSEQMAGAALRMQAALELGAAHAQATGGSELKDSAVTDLSYRGLRFWGLAQVRLQRMAKSMPSTPVSVLLAIAWAALKENLRPPHVIVSQAVDAAKLIAAEHQSNFVNALLRKTLSEPDAGEQDFKNPIARFNAPHWWIDRIMRAYPKDGEKILLALSGRPPLTVRFDGADHELQSFQDALSGLGHQTTRLGEKAYRISPPMPVEKIPGFLEGLVSVQDASAQRALDLFDDLYGRRSIAECFQILDACAAPGGKAIGLAQRYDAQVWALDSSGPRLSRLQKDLSRVGPRLKGSVMPVCADVLNPQGWPDGIKNLQFDAVLLDAPCTASGVARRHPEIPWKRKPLDISRAAQIQQQMLDSLWPKVKPGGELVFVTCSVFPEEGEAQQSAFLARTPNAQLMDAPGRLLPIADPDNGQDQDGFFYARFSKNTSPDRAQ